MNRFTVCPMLELDADSINELSNFLDNCVMSSAYQYPYRGSTDEWLFQMKRDDETFFSGRANLGYATGLRLPLLKVLSFNRGPVATNLEDFIAGMEQVLNWARHRGFIYVQVMPDVVGTEILNWITTLETCGWKRLGDGNRYTLRISLSSEEESLLAGMSTNGRYKVKRAWRENISVFPGETTEHLNQFWEIHCRMAMTKGIPAIPRSLLDALWALRQQDPTRVALFLAHHNGDILGGNLIFRSGNRCEYLFGATLKQGSVLHGHVSAGYPLQWVCIQWAKSVGCKVYDFGGFTPGATTGPAVMKAAFMKDPIPVQLAPRLIYVVNPAIFMLTTLLQKLKKSI